jgi:hypothetical protein
MDAMPSRINKAYHEGDRVYLQPGEEPPPGARAETGPRGGRFFRWRASSGHGGWEQRRRTARRGARLARAQEPRPGAAVATSAGPARVREMLPSGGAVVETARGPARMGPETLADAAKDQQLDELDSGGQMPASPGDLLRLVNDDPAAARELFAAIYDTPGYQLGNMRMSPGYSGEATVSMRAEILDDRGNNVGNLQRSMDTGTGTVHHDLFVLEPGHQGGSLAARMNRQAEGAYIRMGFRRVDLEADMTVGKYAWARQGYDFKDPIRDLRTAREGLESFLVFETLGRVSDRRQAGLEAERLLAGVEHSWDLAALDDGQLYEVTVADGRPPAKFPLGKAFMLSRWWISWAATKDLRDGSAGRAVGDSYLHSADRRPTRRSVAAAAAPRGPFILPAELAGTGGDDFQHWRTDEATDAAWRRRLGRISGR